MEVNILSLLVVGDFGKLDPADWRVVSEWKSVHCVGDLAIVPA